MIKTLTIALVVAAGFTGTAFARPSHHRAPADAAAYYATYDHRAAAPAATPAPAQRSDFGSFSAGATANNLGYTAR